MVTTVQVENGLASYLDSQFMTKLPSSGIQRLIIGTTVSIIIKRVSNLIEDFSENAILNTLGVIDEDSNIDIDIIAEELKKQIPEEGFSMSLGSLGGNMNITFHKGDVDELLRLIKCESVSTQVVSDNKLHTMSPLPSGVVMKGGMR